LPKTACTELSTAASRSASAKRMLGDLPPSSRETFLIVSAAPFMISAPVAVSPVKATFPTPGWAASAAPTVLPGPVTMFRTPGGSPAASATSPRSRADRGLQEAGFRTTVLPVARAGATFQAAMMKGKFQGTMRAQTPIGSRRVKSRPGLATGITSPKCLVTAPA
jgi:hypothetical protein